jgi:hypothetical protein
MIRATGLPERGSTPVTLRHRMIARVEQVSLDRAYPGRGLFLSVNRSRPEELRDPLLPPCGADDALTALRLDAARVAAPRAHEIARQALGVHDAGVAASACDPKHHPVCSPSNSERDRKKPPVHSPRG